MEKRWYRVTWEMRVQAESEMEAETKAAQFAMNADKLSMDPRYDNFKVETLSRGDFELVPTPPTTPAENTR